MQCMSDDSLLIRATAALSVITIDPAIRGWLEEHDPKALGQADRACEELFERTKGLGRELWEAEGFGAEVPRRSRTVVWDRETGDLS